MLIPSSLLLSISPMNAVWSCQEPDWAARAHPAPHVPDTPAGGKERRTPAGAEVRPGGSHQQLLSAGPSRGEGASRDGGCFSSFTPSRLLRLASLFLLFVVFFPTVSPPLARSQSRVVSPPGCSWPPSLDSLTPVRLWATTCATPSLRSRRAR